MSDLSIREIIAKISEGVIRIPAFQRSFVWEAESIAFLMDSIYKEYPFGTIQLWRTSEELKTEKQIGPFKLFQRDQHYPIDYILDGQQRITSIFGVFQTELTIADDQQNPFNIYFDYKADHNLQESQFFALSDNEVDSGRHFPLNILFDTVKYRQKTTGLNDEDAEKIDRLQAKFKEAKIPIQTLETNDKAKVSIVFERINRKGVPLDNYQLLTAWTWSEDFDLQDKFLELTEELEPYGFEEVGGNSNLLLRICSAIILKDASVNALINVNGATVRNRFDEVLNGVKGAIDFVKSNLKVQKLDNLPYSNILIPLSVFFANQGNQHFNYNDIQRKTLEKWFWRACFSRRYSAGIQKALDKDIEEIEKLKQNLPSNLASFSANVTSDFFTKNQFVMGTVNTKTFILMLAQNDPKSFITGSPITLSSVLKEYNRNEFHHVYPKAFVRSQNDITNSENCLANFCFMSRADNKKLGGVAPSMYRHHLVPDTNAILDTAFIDESILVSDNFDNFIDTRTDRLLKYVNTLIN